MKKLGLMIRKFDKTDNGKYCHPSRRNLNKQILTLHKRIKKKDKVYTEYSIEKDTSEGKYHTHLIIHYNNKENLHNQLSRFIGGYGWKVKVNGAEVFNECNGKWGSVHTHPIISERNYRWYINKDEPSKTLI